ncbi:hypothetical protein GQR58_022037 [Nymphon striatum]|nr:hypothetical protein GQR58_022037 [Nymphon striatum]
MKFLFAGIFLVVSVMLSFSLGSREWQLAFIGLSTIVGFLLGQVLGLSKELKSLRNALAEDWAQRNAESTQASEAQQVTSAESTSAEKFEERDDFNATAETQTSSAPLNEQQQEYVETITQAADNVLPDSTINQQAISESIDNAVSVSSNAADTSSDTYVPPVNAVVEDNILEKTYALLLQGAGIGILYLDIFAAFSMYKLIEPTLAFVLLFVVSMLSAALAVLQDSKSLAVLGFSGGFLAPVLASSGSNNHISLFSYYAVLNVAIVAIAWFKAWRPLNLLGFAFTFIIGTVWGVLRYDDSKFATTEPFLIIFFLFYVLIAVLFALRQPPKLRGYVDGTLLFGVPLAASALQYSLVKDFEYGVSISSFAMGLFYIVLSWFVWKRKGDGLKLLSEAFLALGVIFASMAIPFALAPTQTAAAWALEGAGLLWLGSRQNRLSVRAFGLILQFGAGLIFLARFNYIADLKPFMNGHFISTMMMAVAGIISARLLIKEFEGRRVWEKGISPIVLGWGLLWLFGGFVFQLLEHYDFKWMTSNLLILSALISLGFTFAATRLKPQWTHA